MRSNQGNYSQWNSQQQRYFQPESNNRFQNNEESKPINISPNASYNSSSPQYMKSPKNRANIIITDNNITIKPRKQSPLPPSNKSTYTPTRRVWTQSSSRMSSYEIDNILRIQDMQLQSLHPYIEDFYFQNYLNKQAEHLEIPTYNHVPLYDAIGSSSFVKQGVKLEGVLGQIPSRSTKAPRPLLTLQNELKSEQEQHTSILLLIENAFDRILDIEDIDKLVLFSNPSEEVKDAMNQKRVEIIKDLFRFVPLFILDSSSEQPRFREDAICSWEEDQPLLKFLNTQKGRKLLTRMIPLLPGFYAHGVFLFFMRNLSLILGILDQNPDDSSKNIIPTLLQQLSSMSGQQIQVCLQVLTHFHKDDLLLYVMQTRNGLALLNAMFYQIMVFYSRPPPPQMMQEFMGGRQQWFQTVDFFFRKFIGRFDKMFDTQEQDRFSFYHQLFTFFCTWSNHIGPQHHKIILTEIAERTAFISQEYNELIPIAHELVSALMRE